MKLKFDDNLTGSVELYFVHLIIHSLAGGIENCHKAGIKNQTIKL